MLTLLSGGSGIPLNKAAIRRAIEDADQAVVEAVLYDWAGLWARPDQLTPPGDWLVWVIKSGRGWGKTRTGAEQVRRWVEEGVKRIHLVGRTPADVRDVMVEGESGILAISPPWNRPRYEPSRRRLVWPNGAMALCFASSTPDVLRGPQCEKFWADEVAAWRYQEETWDNLLFGNRLGDRPQGVVTTTPRPTATMRSIVSAPGTIVTTGSTQDNVQNLAAAAVRRLYDRYAGTRLGRQELFGEMLDDNPNAIFKRSLFDRDRLNAPPKDLRRIVVGVDPHVVASEKSAQTGIVIGAEDYQNPPHYYILDDMSISGLSSPGDWANQVIAAYHINRADYVVAEVNNGGDLVVANIASVDPNVPIRKVTATRGKTIRAEPVANLSEQGRLHFVGHHPECEDECVEWDPQDGTAKSPDRMDAMVWAITELMGGGNGFIGGGWSVY